MIVYFTGTGNSRHVAFKIASHMEEEKILSIGDMIKKGETGNFQSETPYVFVMPTYGWRMPRVAEKFIKESKFSGSNKAYFVLTCGDSCGNAGEYARRLCHEKDMEYMGCFQVKMPENYIAMFSVPDERESERIVKAADISARLFCEYSILKAVCTRPRLQSCRRLQRLRAMCRRVCFEQHKDSRRETRMG